MITAGRSKKTSNSVLVLSLTVILWLILAPTLSMTYGTNESSYKLGYASGKIDEVDLVTENCHLVDTQNTILQGIIISGIRIDNPK
ncbi:MAG: hypothetical protein WBZ36_11465 [Candidatus Nitrosopolaris sp.]